MKFGVAKCVRTGVKLVHNKSKRLLLRQKPLGWMGLILIEKVLANQHLHQLVPIDLTDHGTGIVVIGDVGGIFSQQIANDLVNGVVAFLIQGIEHTTEKLAHILFIIVGDCKLEGILIRHGLSLLKHWNIGIIT